MKSAAIKSLLVLESLIVLFVLIEAGFRVMETFSETGEGWAIYDEDLGYRPRPHHEDFNVDGLRDHSIDAVKTKFRILNLGDSVSFYGDSIEDTYVGHLETQLNTDHTLAPVEVINAGVRGYTNYQELGYLKKYGLAFQPDLVGVGFVLNDLHQYLHKFKIEDGKIVGDYTFTEEAVQSVESPFYQLARKSHFLVWLRQNLSVFENLVEIQAQDGYTFEYRPDFKTAWQEEPWQAIEQQLGEMVALGRRYGFRVFLVAFPFAEQMREDYLAQDAAYVMMPQRRLKTLCVSVDIPFLDLFPVLDPTDHIHPDGIHLTARGRIVAAEAIASFLKDQRLIPLRTDHGVE